MSDPSTPRTDAAWGIPANADITRRNLSRINRRYRAVVAGSTAKDAYDSVGPGCCRSVFYRTLRDPLYAKIDAKAWLAVQDAMSKSFRPRRTRSSDFPLKGILRCCDCGGNLTASTAKGRYDYYHCRHPGHRSRISTNAINSEVSRLLSEECERLQGFEIGYTRIPWKGKTPEDCPDGPRYKALGNSMAVPVMRWIGMRIDQAKEKR